MKLAIASNNKGKIEEINRIFHSNELRDIEIVNPSSLGIISNPEETSETLEGNALIKAKALNLLTSYPAIADDTGLFVETLNGKPGVYSARYAGENATDADNRKKLLLDIGNSKNRKAYFETVICYYDSEIIEFFSGKCHGTISKLEIGSNGFGYDPIFIPEGYDRTFAEMDSVLKSKISHRYLATDSFIKWYKMELG